LHQTELATLNEDKSKLETTLKQKQTELEQQQKIATDLKSKLAAQEEELTTVTNKSKKEIDSLNTLKDELTAKIAE
jgi:predicted  nucleic acid-binding Zn-ribbon protein